MKERRVRLCRSIVSVAVNELVKEKSQYHRLLEEALQKNKEAVYRLVSNEKKNSSEIDKLRKEAMNLTKELTFEIQREVKEEEEEERRMY